MNSNTFIFDYIYYNIYSQSFYGKQKDLNDWKSKVVQL